MKITIGHLFYDLLNLYGESGNVLALKKALEMQNIEVDVKNLSLDESWKLQEFDFLYMGTGTNNNQKIALNFLRKYKEDIKEYIENNKYFLVTGNSIELFGECILDNELRVEALDIFKYSSEKTSTRQVSECIFNLNGINSKILGFENNNGKTVSSDTPMFKVEKGFGTINDETKEGFMYKNFYATYLIGPVLARNPELLENICKALIISKDNNFEFKDFDFQIEKEAHERYMKRYENP